MYYHRIYYNTVQKYVIPDKMETVRKQWPCPKLQNLSASYKDKNRSYTKNFTESTHENTSTSRLSIYKQIILLSLPFVKYEEAHRSILNSWQDKKQTAPSNGEVCDELCIVMPETYKFSLLILTILAPIATAECSFSNLKKIKT